MADEKPELTYYERNRERILARLNEKYRTDPEFRERARKRSRERYHEDEAYRKATIERAKARYRRLKKDRSDD